MTKGLIAVLLLLMLSICGALATCRRVRERRPPGWRRSSMTTWPLTAVGLSTASTEPFGCRTRGGRIGIPIGMAAGCGRRIMAGTGTATNLMAGRPTTTAVGCSPPTTAGYGYPILSGVPPGSSGVTAAAMPDGRQCRRRNRRRKVLPSKRARGSSFQCGPGKYVLM